MTQTKRVYFVDFKGWMKASLDLGLSFHDAIREFLDNSVDAKATNIHIGLQKIPATDDKSEGTRIFIIDNGTGVPATVTDSDGYTYDGLPYVLSFGGRERSVNVDGTARTIGRFGVGLSSAMLSSQGVYSPSLINSTFCNSTY